MNELKRSNYRYNPIDYMKFLKLVWKRIWLVLLLAVVGGGIAFAYAKFWITPAYQSTSMMFVNNSDVSIGATQIKISSSDITGGSNLIATYRVIMGTRETLEQVIDEANLPYSTAELKGMITTSTVEDTSVLNVTATSANPEEAALIVNTMCKILPDRITEIVDGTSVRIVEKGIVNTRQVSPNITRYVEYGLLIGAAFAVGLILLMYFLDSQIHDESFVDDLGVDISILSSIPDLTKRGRKGYYSYKYGKNDYRYAYSGYDQTQKEKDVKVQKGKEIEDGAVLCKGLSFAASEAYKLLRTNLYYALSDVEGSRVIGITSSIRGEGKSTTSINLAYTIAETGKRVLLIEGDLRLPNIAKRLNLKNALGLSNVLARLCSANDALQPSGILDSFYVMSCGTIPPNPSELLGSAQMKSLLKQSRKNFDYVILDLPPVNVVADALSLSEDIDGLLLTVRQDYCDYPSINETLKKVSFADANILGFVMTWSTAASKTGYGSRYKRYKSHAKSYYSYGNYNYGYYYKKSAKRNPDAKAMQDSVMENAAAAAKKIDLSAMDQGKADNLFTDVTSQAENDRKDLNSRDTDD